MLQNPSHCLCVRFSDSGFYIINYIYDLIRNLAVSEDVRLFDDSFILFDSDEVQWNQRDISKMPRRTFSSWAYFDYVLRGRENDRGED